MADKTIGELPSISYLDSGSLFVAEQNGEAVKVSGKQLTDFSNVETTAQVEQAKASAQAAQAAKESAEAAILKNPIIQNGTWWVYNQTAGVYQNTGINATGPKGDTGPTSSVNGISPDASGNITLTAGNVGAAPAGFGWGEHSGKNLPEGTDLDEVRTTGIYTWGGYYLPNAPTVYAPDYHPNPAWGQIFVENGVQHYFSWNCPQYMMRRYRSGNGWSPWEWVNPPMRLNTEYRTTERYLDKPVYVKVVDFGALPNNTEKQISLGISNFNAAIFVSATTNGGDLIPFYNTTNGGKIEVSLVSSYDGGKVRILTNYAASASSAYVKIKYTKTTD